MIERTEGICGGRARIAGTRIAVWLIILAGRRSMDSELLKMWPHLTQANLDEARDYYDTHRKEIDRDITDQEATEKK